jgi:hypothetical protein
LETILGDVNPEIRNKAVYARDRWNNNDVKIEFVGGASESHRGAIDYIRIPNRHPRDRLKLFEVANDVLNNRTVRFGTPVPVMRKACQILSRNTKPIDNGR